MVPLSVLKQVADEQRLNIKLRDTGLLREKLADLPDITSRALVVSGVRQGGKSVLLSQWLTKKRQDAFYLHFEDFRLSDFEWSDFQSLDMVIRDSRKRVLFFEEIQVVASWELYVGKKLDEGFCVVCTNSNASWLNQAPGAKLAEKYISKELFPFSYREFLQYKVLKKGTHSLVQYLDQGGFPEYLKTGNPNVWSALFNDIIHRDIIVRHGVRDVSSLKRLVSYLMSHVGNLVTASKLKQILSIKTTVTVLEYFSYIEQTYLVHFLPKFSHSLKSQMINPRKIYVVDPGFIRVASTLFTKDKGYLLENCIYGHLKRTGYDLYYFSENGCECDFVVMKNGQVKQLVQVCYELNPENTAREQKGLKAAMDSFGVDKGWMVTFRDKGTYAQGEQQVKIVPAYEYLLENI